MEKFRLSNGLLVINAGHCEDYAACLGFNVGSLNEPKPGLARLFERVLLLSISGVLPYYGGVSTAFSVSGEDLDEVLEALGKVANVEITEELVKVAKAEIRRQVIGSGVQVQQVMRQMFHRRVLGTESLVFNEAYMEQIDSYQVADVKDFQNKYYTAANAVLLISSPDSSFLSVREKAENVFGCFERGEKQGDFLKKSYCGGYGHVDAYDGINRVMLGWDLTKFTTTGNSVLEVMLQVFSKELAEALIKARMYEAAADLKLVSYMGISCARVVITSEKESLDELCKVVYGVIKNLCLFDWAKDLPKNQPSPVFNDLSNVSDLSEERLFKIFEQVTGQVDTPEIGDDGASSLEETTGEDIKLMARRFFLGSKLTCVSASEPNGDEGLEFRINRAFERLQGKV